MDEKREKILLSLDNMKSILFDKYDKNFTFIVDGKSYQTNRFFADILSPIVNNYHYDDETINEIEIITKNKNIYKGNLKDHEQNSYDYFSDFLSLATFKEQEIDDIHKIHYSNYFLQLGNISEYLRLQNTFLNEMAPDNCIGRLKLLSQNSIERKQDGIIDKMISYLAANFEYISKDELQTLDISEIEEIISSDELKLRDEDSLLEFILELYSYDSIYSSLFEYVIFKNVSESIFESFISEFSIENMNSKIWERICDRFLPSNETSQKMKRYLEHIQKRIIQKEFNEGEEFNGILRYLSDQTNGNIHDNGTVNITSNSIQGSNLHPKNLVDYQNGELNNYCSQKSIKNAYVCFDFKDRKVQLSSYSIKSFAYEPNKYNLKSWVIEGSNNGFDWNVIDEHQNDETLNGPRIIGNFNINDQQDFYRFIRLRQIGKNWHDDYYIVLYSLELYGIIEEPN